MKQILIVIISIFLSLNFSACTNNIENKLNNAVAAELENYDEDLDDETLKAMSVIIRTNLKIDNNFSDKNTNNKKYLKIASSTNNETIKNNNNELQYIYLEDNINYNWSKTIKKSRLLDYAQSNNINLTNISKITPIYNDERLQEISIGNRTFDYRKLANHFNLESNSVQNIENTNNEIIISGNNKGFYDYFDKNKSKKLSENNKNYREILSEFYNDLNLLK